MVFPETYGPYEILAALAPYARTYLGIGIQEGVCVQHVVRANPSIDLTLCDTWGLEHGGTGRGSHDHVVALLAAARHTGRVTFLDGPSQILVPALPDEAQFDLTYVDGAHNYEPALHDLLAAWPRTRGVMVVHDLAFPEVAQALQAWRAACDPDHRLVTQQIPAGTGTLVVYR
jgi:hypothetical protein